MAYSIIGDAVNVAARLEALNKPLQTTVLASEATWSQLPEALQESLPPQGAHTVKGRQQPVIVYGR
jgi:adenylate cyclase